VARVGRDGELRTARVLDEVALSPGGPTVLHDLTVPGSRANVDHAVVAGRRVLLVDSKSWRPGWYWSVGGRAFRGTSRFAFAEKRTNLMAVDKITALAARTGVRVEVVTPWTVVWPSSARGGLHLWALRLPGARMVPGGRLRIGSSWRRPADPAVVDLLASLCTSAPSAGRVPRQRSGDRW
jgi:hypothetical protein